MARIAGRSGLHMRGGLTCNRTAVMAGIAGALHHALGYPVLKTAGRPTDISVTGFAGRRGRDMRCRFSWRLAAGTVAGGTVAGRAAEQPLSVAGFAAHLGVGAIQKETSGVVIE